MKFRFEQIGPIDAADLELGDLTIIAGRNNTGKTYLVYTLYGFLRTWASAERLLLPNGIRRDFTDFLRAELGSSLSVERRQVSRLRRRTIEHAAVKFSEGRISHIFNSPPSSFGDARLSVELGAPLPSNGRRITLSSIDGLRVNARYDEEAVNLELVSRIGTFSSRRPPIVALAMNVALPDVPRPFILSSERFGIALFYKELDFTKSRLVEMLQLQMQFDDEQSRPDPTPLLVLDRVASRYAMPVKDNVDFTRNIENVVNQDSDFLDAKLHEEVKELMSGYYTSTGDVIRFKSRDRKGRPFDIPLHIASSSARGLSDLYFYLRHVASRNDILFIDEPETHLDTANQVQLAHMISKIVQAGLKVLVSTHSDYLLKEINNLVMVDHLRRNDRLDRGYLNYAPGGGLGRERIRAYVAENNSLTPCVVDRYGIDAPVFDKTIDRINRASSDLAFAVTDAEEAER